MKKFSLFAIYIMACLLAGCEPKVPAISEPLVTTIDATQISFRAATVRGNVTDDGGSEVVERGICYSTSANPSISNKKIVCGSGLGEFTCDLTDLERNTKYYVRAYATNSVGSSYGNEIKFTTLDKIQPEAIDLGLSVKWANMNVGAESPEDYGDYFAWGETSTKSTYELSTYKWWNNTFVALTKYCTDNTYGTVDRKTVLEIADDVATVNWGSNWRMPTSEEQNELRENCTWTWTTQNGVNGYKVTSKRNGNFIFLPAAGGRRGSSLKDAGSYGRYWSSTLHVQPLQALNLIFQKSYVDWSHDSRYSGLSVRPVCE